MPILNMIAQGSGGGGGGGNVGEPTNLSASATSNSSVDIKWTDNNLQALPPSTFQKSVLVRKVGSAPTTPSDGTTVVTETVMNTYQSSAYSDTGLTDGTTYYYQVFSYSTDGGITYGTPVSATPQGGWTPGADTIVYYPFTSQTTVADMSGNNHNLTNGGATFGTFQGVDCVSFNGSSYLETSDTITVPDGCTILAWCYTQNTSGDFRRIVDINAGSRDLMLLYSTGNEWKGYNIWLGGRPTTNTTSYYGAWYLVAGTGLSNVQNLYIYGANTAVDITDNQNTFGVTSASLYVGAGANHSDNFIGGISNLIVESRVRTAQEVQLFYNQTKANYGIS